MHFLQHDYKDKIYSLYWAMNLKLLFWMKHPPVKPKSDWYQHWQKIMHKMHTSKKYGEENSAKFGAKKLARLYSNEIQAEHVIY